MNNHQTNTNPNPLYNIYLFIIRQIVFILTFLTFIHYPILQLFLIIALIMNNTMECAMKREAWTCLPSHLVLAKFFFSRCEPCTNTCSTPYRSRVFCTGKF